MVLQEMLEARKAADEANKANAAQNNAHLGLAPLMLTQGPGHSGGPAGTLPWCCPHNCCAAVASAFSSYIHAVMLIQLDTCQDRRCFD
jgi:hypothetical protein